MKYRHGGSEEEYPYAIHHLQIFVQGGAEGGVAEAAQQCHRPLCKQTVLHAEQEYQCEDWMQTYKYKEVGDIIGQGSGGAGEVIS